MFSHCESKVGVGKSTTAVNLGACLAEAGKRVLLVGSPGQRHKWSGVEKAAGWCMYDVLIEGRDIEEVILPTEVSGLGWRRTLELAGAEIGWCPPCPGIG